LILSCAFAHSGVKINLFDWSKKVCLFRFSDDAEVDGAAQNEEANDRK
jgi:hypothetical protein